MRIIVAGCRHYTDFDQAEQFIDRCLKEVTPCEELIFLSGDCRGADRLGERYAAKHGYKIERFPAQWSKYGRAAGPMRNREMVEKADMVICFWDGKSKGSKSLIGYAEKAHKPLYIHSIPEVQL